MFKKSGPASSPAPSQAPSISSISTATSTTTSKRNQQNQHHQLLPPPLYHHLSTSTQPGVSTIMSTTQRELWAESADSDARFARQLEALGVTYPEGSTGSSTGSATTTSSSNTMMLTSNNWLAESLNTTNGQNDDYKDNDDNNDHGDDDNADDSIGNIGNSVEDSVYHDNVSRQIPYDTSALLSASSFSSNSTTSEIQNQQHPLHPQHHQNHYNNNPSNEMIQYKESANVYSNNTTPMMLEDRANTRALLVQNHRLVSRVKILETSLAESKKKFKKQNTKNMNDIEESHQMNIQLEQKYEADMKIKNILILSMEEKIKERVQKATLLHLNTKKLLTNELINKKHLLKKAIEKNEQINGHFQGRLLSIETLLEISKRDLIKEKENSSNIQRELILKNELYNLTKDEYEKREKEHFQDMKNCQTYLFNLHHSYHQESTNELSALAQAAHQAHQQALHFSLDQSSRGQSFRDQSSLDRPIRGRSQEGAAAGKAEMAEMERGDEEEEIRKLCEESHVVKERILMLEINSFKSQLIMNTKHYERQIELMNRREEKLMNKVLLLGQQQQKNKNDEEEKEDEEKDLLKTVKRKERQRKRRSGTNRKNRNRKTTEESIAQKERDEANEEEDDELTSNSMWSLDESEIYVSERERRKQNESMMQKMKMKKKKKKEKTRQRRMNRSSLLKVTTMKKKNPHTDATQLNHINTSSRSMKGRTKMKKKKEQNGMNGRQKVPQKVKVQKVTAVHRPRSIQAERSARHVYSTARSIPVSTSMSMRSQRPSRRSRRSVGSSSSTSGSEEDRSDEDDDDEYHPTTNTFGSGTRLLHLNTTTDTAELSKEIRMKGGFE